MMGGGGGGGGGPGCLVRGGGGGGLGGEGWNGLVIFFRNDPVLLRSCSIFPS